MVCFDPDRQVRKAEWPPAPMRGKPRARTGPPASEAAFKADTDHESDQADRAISTGKLNALPRLHPRPINVVVFHGSDREFSF